MLDDDFYRGYRVLPTPWAFRSGHAVYEAWLALTRTRFEIEGLERIPAGPCLIATNSTQNQDFMALRTLLARADIPCVTVTKAKNYHHRAMAFALRRLGVVPIASKGYLLLVAGSVALGRRPTDAEYRWLRDRLDVTIAGGRGAAASDGAAADAAAAALAALDLSAVAARYQRSLGETLRLCREAVAAGHHVHMYPEGTVSPRLGVGRIGAVQLAWALDVPLLPVGMSGCPEAFIGSSPLTRGGVVQLRVGEPYQLPRELLPASFRPFDPADEARQRPALLAATEALMAAIDGLLDERYRRDPNVVHRGKGTRALL